MQEKGRGWLVRIKKGTEGGGKKVKGRNEGGWRIEDGEKRG